MEATNQTNNNTNLEFKEDNQPEMIEDTNVGIAEKEGEGGILSLSCCKWAKFHNVDEAKGYSRLGIGRGPLVMANIFLSTAIMHLANIEAGCMDENGIVIDRCENRVYGLKPSSIMTTIGVCSGLLSAFFMPLGGAMVDYTDLRRAVGTYSAFFIHIIQAVSIFVFLETWFILAILQVLAIFLFQVQVLATYAYLPDIARVVGEEVMTELSGLYTILQYLSSILYLIVVIMASTFFDFGTVSTAHFGQGLNVLWSGYALYLGWKLMKERPASHALPQGEHLLTKGFKETWKTAISINTHYSQSVRWYFLALIFAEAGTSSFTIVSVSYMQETLRLDSAEIGILFLITMCASIPGAKFGEFITKKTHPNMSWRLSMVLFIAVTVASFFFLSSPEDKPVAYWFGAGWGLAIGWFYPAENLYFALCMPKGREAELSGFYVYCTQILVWLPPLLFTTLNEAGIHQKWGLSTINIFFLLAIISLSCVESWDVVKDEALKLITDDNDDVEKKDSERTPDEDVEQPVLEIENQEEGTAIAVKEEEVA